MAAKQQRDKARAIATKLHPDAECQIRDGYGDFCFEPPDLHVLSTTASQNSHVDSDAIIPLVFFGEIRADEPTSERAVSAEGRSQHSDVTRPSSRPPFRFMELPRDIRDGIYSWCIEPLRSCAPGGRISMWVASVSAREGDQRCHPYRDGYKIYISRFGDRGYALDRQDYLPIRSLSNSCHTVRQELGAIFWSNVHLNVSGWGYPLLDLMKERPMIAKGVKSVKLKWMWHESLYHPNYNILEFCRYASEHLVLHEVVIVLKTTFSILKKLLKSRGRVEWIQAVRSLNVKSLRFECERTNFYYDNVTLDSDPEYGGGLIDIENQDALSGDRIEGEEPEVDGDVGMEAANEIPDALSAISPEYDNEDSDECDISEWERMWGRRLQALLQRKPTRPKEYTAQEEYLRTRGK